MALFSILCKRSRNVPFFALNPSYSTSPSIAPKPPKIKALTSYHRKLAMEAAMTALKDYLYSTRYLPLSLSEQISLNSPISLSSYLCRLQFPTSSFNSSDFPQFFRRSFSFKEPINEFDFFFESIGVFHKPKPSESLFLSDDLRLVEGVNQLIRLGFPYKKIGLLCPSKALWVAPNELSRRFEKVAHSTFLGRNCIVAICLAFPKVLTRDDADSLLGDLRTFFVDNDVVNSMGNEVDNYLDICEKIQIFYELGSAEGSIGSLLRENDWVIFDTDKKELRKRLDFFAKLGMKEDLGQFLLRNSREIFKLDFELTISIPEYLHFVGVEENEANNVILAYPYVVGKNKLGNLPRIMCAVGLSDWFLSRVQHSNIKLFSPIFVSDALNYDSAIEEEFVKGLEQAKLHKRGKLVIYKVEFLQSIGFGMNKFTARFAAALSGSKEDLHERFELLLNQGIEPKRICKMLRKAPKLLNQSKDSIMEKIIFLCNHLGHNLDYLDSFPAFLCFDLENRIKPRYRILDWLKEVGVLTRSFAPATVLAGSEKKFMEILYAIHPAAPKQWLENFSSRNHRENYRKNLFAPKVNFGFPLVVKSN
ncbi:mTERF [Carex littledalei]|uniref:mTERF n=1 Tax=Carex littledalei TaxID=544730 RepID=A0A833R6Y1_9POAL|nr:mTERF [Carex littledalei]